MDNFQFPIFNKSVLQRKNSIKKWPIHQSHTKFHNNLSKILQWNLEMFSDEKQERSVFHRSTWGAFTCTFCLTDSQLYNSLTVSENDSPTGHESHESSIADRVRSHFPLQMPNKYSPGHLEISRWILILRKGSISISHHPLWDIQSVCISCHKFLTLCFFACVQKSHSTDPMQISLTVPIQSVMNY